MNCNSMVQVIHDRHSLEIIKTAAYPVPNLLQQSWAAETETAKPKILYHLALYRKFEDPRLGLRMTHSLSGNILEAQNPEYRQ